MLHIAGMPPKTTTACQKLIDLHHPDIVVFGHSHKHGVCQQDSILYINPGSAGTHWKRLLSAQYCSDRSFGRAHAMHAPRSS